MSGGVVVHAVWNRARKGNKKGQGLYCPALVGGGVVHAATSAIRYSSAVWLFS